MTDRNGKEIKIGDRAVVIKPGCDMLGSIGDVRDIRGTVGALHGKPGLRIASGPEGNPDWAAWCEGKDVTVI